MTDLYARVPLVPGTVATAEDINTELEKIDIGLNAAFDRTVKVEEGGIGPEFPATTGQQGKVLSLDADGLLSWATMGGADSALRTDLAASNGATRVGHGGVSVATLLTSISASLLALAAATGAASVGYGQTTVEGALDQVIYLKKHGLNKAGLLAALAEQQATGGVLVLPPQSVDIAGWDTPFNATNPLFIMGHGPDASTLNFTGATAAFVHVLDPVLRWSDFTLKGLTALPSGNGGGAAYALAADGATIGASIAPKFHNVRFDGCKSPLNFEVPFDGAEIRNGEYLNGYGHGFRFGNTTGVGDWGTWKRLTVNGWKVRNLNTIGPGNNVYAGLAYGEHHRFDNFDIDGVTGTMDRNGNPWPTEAGGLHFQARYVWVGANNVSRNITNAEVLRGLMVKGETNGLGCVVEDWIAHCGGVGSGVAWYAKSGYGRCTVYNPGVAAVEIGSGLTMTKVHLDVDAEGTNISGVYGIAGTADSGHLSINARLDGFVKPISISGSTGSKSISIAHNVTGGAGNAVEVYLNSAIEEIDLSGRTAITNNSACRWVRGASSAATVNKLQLRGALTNVAGFGTTLDTITINSLDLDQHVSGVTTPGRELTGSAIIKGGRAKTNIGGTTANATPLNALTVLVPNGTSLKVRIDATGKDGTDDYQIERSHGFGAAAGASALRASNAGLVARSGGAGTWDAAAIASGANAVVQFTGAVGKTVTHRGVADLQYAA